MKKILCLLAFLSWITMQVYAQTQSGVTVSGLKVEGTQVTFDVAWSNSNRNQFWSDTVWVFVDYYNMGDLTRLQVSTGSTLTTHNSSNPNVGAIMVNNNYEGMYVVGDARTAGSFSATVKLLTGSPIGSGACAYAVDYPPQAFVLESSISFTGTSPYKVTLSGDGSNQQSVGEVFIIPSGRTITSFTDATGSPGMFYYLTPPTAGTQTWSVADNATSQTYTWSGPLKNAITDCTETTSFGTTDLPTVAYYRNNDIHTKDVVSGSGYFYNWKCVNEQAKALCPYPWRVPTKDDFIALDQALGGSGSNRTSSDASKYGSDWGGIYGGYIDNNSLSQPNSSAYYWSSSPATGNDAYYLSYTSGGNVSPQQNTPQRYGMQVRCVK